MMDAQYQENLILAQDDIDEAAAEISYAYHKFMNSIQSAWDVLKDNRLDGEDFAKQLVNAAEAMKIDEINPLINHLKDQYTLASQLQYER